MCTRDVVPYRMLYTPTHLHHILHNLLHWGIFNAHVNRANRDHQVQPRNDVSYKTATSVNHPKKRYTNWEEKVEGSYQRTEQARIDPQDD